jgi:hypothetical protein
VPQYRHPLSSLGVEWVSQVLVYIFSYMPRLENSAGPSHPRLFRMILYCLRRALQPSATGTSSFRSDTSSSGSAVSPAACMILCVRFVWVVQHYMSILPNHATLDTGGWLTLTRQGLSPCKMHQASLGALTSSSAGAISDRLKEQGYIGFMQQLV